MTRAEDPLIEVSPHITAGLFFDCSNRVDRLDATLGVAFHVVRDRTPETRIAELTTQHVKNGATLFVEVPIEEFDRIAEAIAHDRSRVTRTIFIEIARNASE